MVRYPKRPPQEPFFTRLKDGAKLDGLKAEATVPKKVLLNPSRVEYQSREHAVHISKTFKVSQLKAKARKLGVTINDIFMGSVVKAISDVSVHTKETKVLASMAYSVHSCDNDLVRFQPGNKICALPSLHNFKATLDDQITESKRLSETFKDGRLGFGAYTIANALFYLLPNFVVGRLINRDFLEQESLTCSNIAGSMGHNWTFDGKKTLWVALGTSGDHPVVTLVSLHDTMKITLITRPGFYSNSEQLMAQIEENMSQH